jgi:hypothetical protein
MVTRPFKKALPRRLLVIKNRDPREFHDAVYADVR